MQGEGLWAGMRSISPDQATPGPATPGQLLTCGAAGSGGGHPLGGLPAEVRGSQVPRAPFADGVRTAVAAGKVSQHAFQMSGEPENRERRGKTHSPCWETLPGLGSGGSEVTGPAGWLWPGGTPDSMQRARPCFSATSPHPCPHVTGFRKPSWGTAGSAQRGACNFPGP